VDLIVTMTQHWADKIADRIIEERGDKDEYNFNFGMSVSGMLHIGNLRGELVIGSRVQKVLEQKGKDVKMVGIFYTQDQFKGKDGQLDLFEDPKDAERFTGRRLKDVPDPKGCHGNWPEHFRSEFVPYLDKFGIKENSITTSEFYQMKETKELIKKLLEGRSRARETINRYRKRNPHPEDWIPFNPYCEKCMRIDSTETVDIDFENEKVKYRCRSCEDEGWSSFEDGKLGWRLEWSALWEVLDIDFEPYGKDHATPGGSRDSCIALSKEFKMNYPSGFPFNWVYWKRGGNVEHMTSSGNVGITPEEYLKIGEPDVLTYLYMSTKPMKEIYFNPEEIPTYTRRFDRAEDIYFGVEEARSEKREMNIKRNYELAVKDVPEDKPLRASYKACSFVAQLTDEEERVLDLLEKMEEVPKEMGKRDRERVLRRVKRSRRWIEKFKPDEFLIDIQEDISEVVDKLSDEQKKVLIALGDDLKNREWTATDLQNRIYEMKDEYDISTGDLFRGIYLTVLGKKSGPRAGQLIKAVGQDKVAELLDGL